MNKEVISLSPEKVTPEMIELANVFAYSFLNSDWPSQSVIMYPKNGPPVEGIAYMTNDGPVVVCDDYVANVKNGQLSWLLPRK